MVSSLFDVLGPDIAVLKGMIDQMYPWLIRRDRANNSEVAHMTPALDYRCKEIRAVAGRSMDEIEERVTRCSRGANIDTCIYIRVR